MPRSAQRCFSSLDVRTISSHLTASATGSSPRPSAPFGTTGRGAETTPRSTRPSDLGCRLLSSPITCGSVRPTTSLNSSTRSRSAEGRTEADLVPRKATRDVFVCVPGITGSVLRKDGRDLWNISAGAVFNALATLGGSIRDLRLTDDPADVDDLGDGITAPEVIRDVHLIPGLWKIDGYTKMVRYIEETFDVTTGRNLFEFPYDWRR